MYCGPRSSDRFVNALDSSLGTDSHLSSDAYLQNNTGGISWWKLSDA